MNSPLRLRLDGDALVANWRQLAKLSGSAACGAAVKADGYGLGAVETVRRLAKAGCRDFFVATWAEALALGKLPDACSLSVLHGLRDEDTALALTGIGRPVLNSGQQVARWKAAGGGLCDVMIDTGMNRLGLGRDDLDVLDGLTIDIMMSHLASADEPSAQNEAQRRAFASLGGELAANRMSLANSAGIFLGSEFAFDLTRPGLALYGGIPVSSAADSIRQVVQPEAQIIQRRCVAAGDTIGYNATFTAERTTQIAVLNIGYADGYLRGFSGRGSAGQGQFPVIGRVSMDLIVINVDSQPSLAEGDWVAIDYALPHASQQSGLSQYELLTGLGKRFDRVWC